MDTYGFPITSALDISAALDRLERVNAMDDGRQATCRKCGHPLKFGRAGWFSTEPNGYSCTRPWWRSTPPHVPHLPMAAQIAGLQGRVYDHAAPITAGEVTPPGEQELREALDGPADVASDYARELAAAERALAGQMLDRLDRQHPSWQASGQYGYARRRYVLATDEAERAAALTAMRDAVTADYPALASKRATRPATDGARVARAAGAGISIGLFPVLAGLGILYPSMGAWIMLTAPALAVIVVRMFTGYPFG